MCRVKSNDRIFFQLSSRIKVHWILNNKGKHLKLTSHARNLNCLTFGIIAHILAVVINAFLIRIEWQWTESLLWIFWIRNIGWEEGFGTSFIVTQWGAMFQGFNAASVVLWKVYVTTEICYTEHNIPSARIWIWWTFISCHGS